MNKIIKMVKEWITTILHALLCIIMVFGVLFSRTRIAQGAVLSILVLLFAGIRLFRGCAMDSYETCENKPILADMGKAMTVKDYKTFGTYEFEQTVVGNLLVIHLIKIYALSIFPWETLF